MSAPRVRLVRAVVHLELVVDDGDTLTPLGVDPLVVSAKDWAAFADGGIQTALADLQDRIATAPVDDEEPVK